MSSSSNKQNLNIRETRDLGEAFHGAAGLTPSAGLHAVSLPDPHRPPFGTGGQGLVSWVLSWAQELPLQQHMDVKKKLPSRTRGLNKCWKGRGLVRERVMRLSRKGV